MKMPIVREGGEQVANEACRGKKRGRWNRGAKSARWSKAKHLSGCHGIECSCSHAYKILTQINQSYTSAEIKTGAVKVFA